MCTNFALIRKSGTAELADRLSVAEDDFLFTDNATPGSTVSIIFRRKEENQIGPAIWWLFLQQTDQGLKPHKNYFSVNTNHSKLPKRPEFRQSRCIIPATAFVESQDGKRPHLLEPANGSAIAFGGLYKTWTDKVTGEVIHSASIITLPGHKSLENIHRKSTPLWLPDSAVDEWLDPTITDMSRFSDLLIPALHTDLTATPIDKTTKKNPIAPAFPVAR